MQQPITTKSLAARTDGRTASHDVCAAGPAATARRYAPRLAAAAAFVVLLVGAGWSGPAAAVGGGTAGTTGVRPSLSQPDGRDTTGLRPAWLVLVGTPLAAGALVVASRPSRQRQQTVRRFRAQLQHPSAVSMFLHGPATEVGRRRPDPPALRR